MKKNQFAALVMSLLLLVPVLPTQAAGAQINNISDVAGLLTESEWETLERQAREMTETYGFGVYAIAVDDYEAFVYGDVNDAAEMLYEEYSLGEGEDRDGILLLLSLYDRDYSLIVNGDFGEYAFTGYGREKMADFFLDDFGDDDWYGGFSDYLNWCGNYLEAAQNGEPVGQGQPSSADEGKLSPAFALIPGAIAALLAGILTCAPMHSAKTKRDADQYVVHGGLNLRRRSDMFLHRSVSRRSRETQSSGNHSGGSHHYSSGSHSGRSGKF